MEAENAFILIDYIISYIITYKMEAENTLMPYIIFCWITCIQIIPRTKGEMGIWRVIA